MRAKARKTPGRAKARRPAKPPAAEATRARLEVDERRSQLVTLGIDLFAARSYDEVSIDELARAAGVSKGLLYHYFPTKRDFYVATVREGSRQLLELTTTPDDMPPLERARAGIDAYLAYVDAHAPAYVALMRGGVGADPEVARIVDETRTAMSDRLLANLPDVTPTELVRTAARGWVGFCEATSLDWIERRTVARAPLRDMMIEVLLQIVTIAARGETRSDE